MSKTDDSLPTYDELPIDPKYPPHTSWGIWGEDDNYGTINLLTEERTANVSIKPTFISSQLIKEKKNNRLQSMSRQERCFL